MDICIYIYMDGAKKRREKPCFLAPRSVTSIRLTLSHFLYYLLFEAYRDEMNAIWYQKRKEFHNGVHTVRYKGAWLLVLSPFLSLSFPFYSTFLKIVVWLLCSSLFLSLSLAVSFFRTVLLKSRPCCMFKKESLEFDIGTPRYCLRSRLKIRRLRNRVFFWNARLLPPPPLLLRLLSHSPLHDQTPLLVRFGFLSSKEIFDIRRMLFQYANL